MSNIVSLYIDKYGIRDNESEEKRVRSLVKKLCEKDTIFSDFPFDYMAEEEQLVLLHYLMTNLPERQIMANMKKVDVDRNYMNFVYQSPKSKEEVRNIFESELTGYLPISLANELLTSRSIIRNHQYNVQDVLRYLFERNELIIRLYVQEMQQFEVLGMKIFNFLYIEEYIDYVVNVLLQLLVYRVMKENSVDFFYIIHLLTEKVEELDKLIEKQLSKRKEKWGKLRADEQNYLSAEIVSKCFANYITHRSRFYEEFSIKEILIEEMMKNPKLFEEIPAEYRAEKVIISEEEIRLSKNIITEGLHIDEYKEKIEIVRRFIEIMAYYGGRQCCSSCLQDIKVYFREIFVSKASYKRRQASRIVKEYINQVSIAKERGEAIPEFGKESQYIFVREKINRGYFREKGLSKEYTEKIVFEKKLYDLLLKLYRFYNVEDSVEFIYEVNYNLLKVYEERLED